MTTATAEKLAGKTSSLYHYDELRIVHLELTHRCNAACPMCARNIHGGAVNPDMPLSELSLDDVKAILLPELIGRLKRDPAPPTGFPKQAIRSRRPATVSPPVLPPVPPPGPPPR